VFWRQLWHELSKCARRQLDAGRYRRLYCLDHYPSLEGRFWLKAAATDKWPSLLLSPIQKPEANRIA
jgi:hypothetical protein